VEEVDLPGVPLGVRDALQGEEAQKQLQLYVADQGGVAAREIFHGHGSAGDVQGGAGPTVFPQRQPSAA